MRIGLDFDGTLVTCDAKQKICMRDACSTHDIEIDIDRYWSMKREGFNNIKALERLGVEVELAQLVNGFWMQHIETLEYLRADKLFPGTLSFLDRLSQYAELWLISARKNPSLLIEQVIKLGLSNWFSDVLVVTSTPGSLKKEDYFRNCRLDLYIGDSELDSNAANKAGIDCLLVSTGQRSGDFLTKNTHHQVYEDLESLFQAQYEYMMIHKGAR